MTDQRYWELEVRGLGLTEEEKDEGWHFCPEWDMMLVGPGMVEYKLCICEELL